MSLGIPEVFLQRVNGRQGILIEDKDHSPEIPYLQVYVLLTGSWLGFGVHLFYAGVGAL